MFSGQCLWLVQNLDEKCDDNVFIVIENSAFKIGQGEPDNNFLCSAVH